MKHNRKECLYYTIPLLASKPYSVSQVIISRHHYTGDTTDKLVTLVLFQLQVQEELTLNKTF